jgi:hypothetical protein
MRNSRSILYISVKMGFSNLFGFHKSDLLIQFNISELLLLLLFWFDRSRIKHKNNVQVQVAPGSSKLQQSSIPRLGSVLTKVFN